MDDEVLLLLRAAQQAWASPENSDECAQARLLVFALVINLGELSLERLIGAFKEIEQAAIAAQDGRLLKELLGKK